MGKGGAGKQHIQATQQHVDQLLEAFTELRAQRDQQLKNRELARLGVPTSGTISNEEILTLPNLPVRSRQQLLRDLAAGQLPQEPRSVRRASQAGRCNARSLSLGYPDIPRKR